MRAVKMCLLVSLGFTFVGAGMENPNGECPTPLKDASSDLREEQSEQEKQDGSKLPHHFFNKKVDNALFAKDSDTQELGKQHKAYVDSYMAPFRGQLTSLANIVCEDLKIESRSHVDLILGCMRAPQGTVEAKAFRNFVTLMHAIDRVHELTAQDITDLSLMLTMKKPIEVDSLRKVLKLHD